MGESLTLHRHWIEDRSDLVYIICSSAAFFHHSMVSQTGAGVSTALAYLIHINEFGDTFLRRSTSACDLVMVVGGCCWKSNIPVQQATESILVA